MRRTFYILLMFLAAGFAACGDDEPRPTVTDGDEGRTEEADTAVADTADVDVPKEDTVTFYCIPKEIDYAIGYVEGNFKYDELYYVWDGWRAKHQIISGSKGYVTSLTVGKEGGGYVEQTARMTCHFNKEMRFVLQPESQTGERIETLNKASRDMHIVNDETNRTATGLLAEMTVGAGTTVDGAEMGDRVSLVAFQPMSFPYDMYELEPGGIVKGAIAGVALTPFGCTLDEGADVAVTMPCDMEAYDVAVSRNETWDMAGVMGDKVIFTAFEGAEYMITMEARVVGVEKDTIHLVSNMEAKIGKSPVEQRSGYSVGMHYPKVGFRPETELNAVEEQFLHSLFGWEPSKMWYHYGSNLCVFANCSCTLTFNVVQNVCHYTFEAGGRQFRAAVYGDYRVEVVSAHDNEGHTYP